MPPPPIASDPRSPTCPFMQWHPASSTFLSPRPPQFALPAAPPQQAASSLQPLLSYCLEAPSCTAHLPIPAAASSLYFAVAKIARETGELTLFKEVLDLPAQRPLRDLLSATRWAKGRVYRIISLSITIIKACHTPDLTFKERLLL